MLHKIKKIIQTKINFEQTDTKPNSSRWLDIIAPALQIQLALFFGFLISLMVSFGYFLLDDPRYPKEQPQLLLIGLLISLILFLLGNSIGATRKFPNDTDFKRGAFIVITAWIISAMTSATVFFLADFPSPENIKNYSLLQRMIDSLYESFSGLTTAGTSILPSVEVFPRGLLFWRTTTHLLGGMGMAYLTITVWKYFFVSRSEIINAESETHIQIRYDSEKDAKSSGINFLKVYLTLTTSLFILLSISGWLWRNTPYKHWYDNLFDSINYAMSTMGTGGFGVYNQSVGLPDQSGIIGGLQNPASEWIIAFFMFFAGINFALWYILLFQEKKKIREIIKNKELRWYTGFVLFTTIFIWFILWNHEQYSSQLESLRYAFFNVNTIISTTGLANQDFTSWPVAAQGVLFVCYFVGGSVGSTAGGMKIARYMVAVQYAWIQLKNFLHGTYHSSFNIDNIRFTDRISGMVLVNMLAYLLIFLLGGILLMISSPHTITPTGQTIDMDFTTAFTASIAHLGNIGPAAAIGELNTGPTGNYSGFSEITKIILMLLMLLGRLGILTFLMLFITQSGQKQIKKSLSELDYDSDVAALIR